ncbi:hypothetical protein [Microcystis phage Mvi-JY20]|uniref:Uncharacterized protein n=1 Tax=Microcystis phage Mvi-JY20 TaxID=3128146 RepID=A0AAX4QG78_9CAUD
MPLHQTDLVVQTLDVETPETCYVLYVPQIDKYVAEVATGEIPGKLIIFWDSQAKAEQFIVQNNLLEKHGVTAIVVRHMCFDTLRDIARNRGVIGIRDHRYALLSDYGVYYV